jgi:hypothetical protein
MWDGVLQSYPLKFTTFLSGSHHAMFQYCMASLGYSDIICNDREEVLPICIITLKD